MTMLLVMMMVVMVIVMVVRRKLICYFHNGFVVAVVFVVVVVRGGGMVKITESGWAGSFVSAPKQYSREASLTEVSRSIVYNCGGS